MNHLRGIVLIILVVAASFSILHFQFSISHAYSSPGSPQGYVSDFADILSEDQEQLLETKLTDLESQTRHELAIVTITSLEGDTIENYAVQLFQEWGIGKQNADNGVLLLVAPNDREVRVEVGYGLEGSLTDAQSYWIIQEQILPPFRNNDYFTGISQGTDQIIAAIQGEAIPSAEPEGEFQFPEEIGFIFFAVIFVIQWLFAILARTKSWWLGGVLGAGIGVVISLFAGFLYSGLIAIIFLTIFGFIFDFLISKAYRHSTRHHTSVPWWAGGNSGFGSRSSGGGGFGGFSGGSSGGGGASGRW